MRAGVYDSGIGGLTVVKSLIEQKLFDEIIYFGDTARVPYGVKDKNTIIRYSLEALEFFKNFDIDIMIAACNSVSAYAIDELKANAPFKVSGVIEPGVMALKNKIPNLDANILVLGTTATIRSGKYERLLKQNGYKNINSLSPSLFVPVVEEGLFEGVVLETVARHYFEGIDEPDVIILGCTHFPLIKDEISKFFPSSLLIHSGEAVVEFLQKEFLLNQTFKQTSLKLFASENPDKLKKIASVWL